MKRNWEYGECPRCGSCVRITDGTKIAQHERGLGYVPYRMYQKFSKISGNSVKEIYQKNICKASGNKDYTKRN